ncbi:hypothetical protein [Acinetobacter stercoris]|uniref:Uncharacterized protein n=1 Tax=Acinetobacter stercoris TaxID=2126983 RepID=A0A2U3MVT0_9GAMM|nr:hypothetical protein [Acinetobacter stercoris]SPL69463.1 hypothetical protein KPC_0641 [Acinetobacter stercoris]
MIKLQPDESYASLLSTHHITQAYIQPFIGYTPNNRPSVGLDDYLKLYCMIAENKTFKIISKQPTYECLVPHVYLTPKGVNLLKIIQDIPMNPFLTGKFSDVIIRPEIKLMVDLLHKHTLINFPLGMYQQFEAVVDGFCQDLKVRSKTRDFVSLTNHWDSSFGNSRKAYNRFEDAVLYSNPMFQVHSLLVSAEFMSVDDFSMNPRTFAPVTVDDILQKTSSKIIEAVWENNAKNMTVGIVSKQETNIQGFKSIRLIFFVAREDTDFSPFAESQLYTDVEPFVFREGKTSVVWSDIACMNSGVEPLVYDIESNFYDSNQNYIGMRLTTLKYSLIGPEYWVRFKYTNTTLKVEKSSY